MVKLKTGGAWSYLGDELRGTEGSESNGSERLNGRISHREIGSEEVLNAFKKMKDGKPS